MACLILLLAVIGFTKTFILPVARGTFAGATVFYVHGGLVFSWILLFVVQSWLIRRQQVATHRVLGSVALVLVPAIALSTIAVGVAAMKRDLAQGMGPMVVSSFVGVITSMGIFTLFVALALIYRRRGASHKRLMLLATIAILWPATFRFRHYFPAVPHPEIIFALIMPDALIVAAMLRDKATLGRVHPVYRWGGLGLIAEQTAEVILFDTPGWREVGQWLAGAFL